VTKIKKNNPSFFKSLITKNSFLLKSNKKDLPKKQWNDFFFNVMGLKTHQIKKLQKQTNMSYTKLNNIL